MSFKGIKEEIGNYIKSRDGLRNNYQNYALKSVWADVAGSTVAKYTSHLMITNKKLFITINSAPLKQEMLYSKDALLEKVNKHLQYEAITDIVIK